MGNAAGADSNADIVNQHFADTVRAAGAMQEVTGKSGCRDFRHMLVFADRCNLCSTQTAHAHTIIQSNHRRLEMD